MKDKYKVNYSNLFSLPGGGPQGTLLGLFLFLELINDVGYKDQVNNVGE
jgi:predicted component of type VI protein secretion system